MTKPKKLLHQTAMALAALALAGCAGFTPSPDSSTSHPANMHAAQGTVPPPVPMLMGVTNMVMVKPVAEPTAEHQHGHEKHEAKPKVEEEK